MCVDQACHYYHKLSICVITVSKCFWNRFEVSKRFQIIRFELSTPPLWNFKPPKRQDFKAKCETSNNYFEVSKGWLWSFKGNCFEVSKFGVWNFKAISLNSHWKFKSISKPFQHNDNTYWQLMTVLACLINKKSHTKLQQWAELHMPQALAQNGCAWLRRRARWRAAGVSAWALAADFFSLRPF